MKGHQCSAPYGSGIVMNEGDDSFPKNSSDNVILSDGGGFVVFEGCAPTGGGCFRKGNTGEANGFICLSLVSLNSFIAKSFTGNSTPLNGTCVV